MQGVPGLASEGLTSNSHARKAVDRRNQNGRVPKCGTHGSANLLTAGDKECVSPLGFYAGRRIPRPYRRAIEQRAFGAAATSSGECSRTFECSSFFETEPVAQAAPAFPSLPAILFV
jgi:hypothetical protein